MQFLNDHARNLEFNKFVAKVLNTIDIEEVKKQNSVINNNFSRKHGLQVPKHPRQTTLVLYIILNQMSFWLFLITLRFKEFKYANIVYFLANSILLAILLYFGYKTTVYDPTDISVYIQQSPKLTQSDKNKLDDLLNDCCQLCKALV
jgi:uncharacterized membrane protein